MREVIDNYKNPRDADQKILEIQGRVATTSMIASQMKNVMEGINPITNNKGRKNQKLTIFISCFKEFLLLHLSMLAWQRPVLFHQQIRKL